MVYSNALAAERRITPPRWVDLGGCIRQNVLISVLVEVLVEIRTVGWLETVRAHHKLPGSVRYW